MAEVFLCRQVGMGGFDRLVVVKRIRADLQKRDDVIHMFLDEARIAAQISHPNVVQTFEIDEERGLPYLVMEYVRGLSFAALHQAMQARGQLLPVDLVAALGAQVCAGLKAAHELRDSDGTLLNVMHRDISPSNLILSTDGVVKIIDFGIARAKGRLARTQAGQIKGRPAYLPPELLGGAKSDRRADLYSLGVVLHEMVCGRLLFDRPDDIATLGAVLAGEVPPLSSVRPDVSPEMERIIAQALRGRAEDRPAHAAAMGSALHEAAMRTGRYVSPPLLADYLENHLAAELRGLPDHRLPTTSRMPLLSQRPTSSRSTLLTRRTEEPTAVITIVREITERVRAASRWNLLLWVLSTIAVVLGVLLMRRP
jgi:serine/threonine-protein kinase